MSILWVFITISSFIHAAHIANIPITLKQPDNTMLNCYATGDEYHARLHDDKNYTITQSNIDGFYYYAKNINGNIIPSIYKPNQINPTLTDLQPGILISREQYKIKKMIFWKNIAVRDAPTVGTINNINIFIRFADEVEFTSPRSVYDQPFNDPSGPSINNYYKILLFNI